jgi:hypothetical protein
LKQRIKALVLLQLSWDRTVMARAEKRRIAAGLSQEMIFTSF